MIEFAGIRSDERYLIVEHYPQRFFPKRKYNVQAIPGGDKDYIIDEGEDAFSNYTQPYSVFFDSKGPGLSQASRKIAEWLLGNPGYQRLEDSYDPDFYRLAYYAGGEQFLNHFNEYGRGTLTFNCAPKRYYKSGEQEITLTNGQTLYSPSSFKAQPIFKVTGNGSGNAVIRVTAKDGTYKEFRIMNLNGIATVYSREHKVLDSNGNDLNSSVNGDYENLYLPSECSINVNTGVVTSISVIPRWWTI